MWLWSVAGLYHRVYMGHSFPPSRRLFDIDAEESRLRHLPNQSLGYSWLRTHAPPAPVLDLVFREDQQQVLYRPRLPDLGSTAPRCPGGYPGKFRSLGEIHFKYTNCRISVYVRDYWYVLDNHNQKAVLTLYSRFGQPQRRFCKNKNGRHCAIQHVCPSKQHRFFKCKITEECCSETCSPS